MAADFDEVQTDFATRKQAAEARNEALKADMKAAIKAGENPPPQPRDAAEGRGRACRTSPAAHLGCRPDGREAGHAGGWPPPRPSLGPRRALRLHRRPRSLQQRRVGSGIRHRDVWRPLLRGRSGEEPCAEAASSHTGGGGDPGNVRPRDGAPGSRGNRALCWNPRQGPWAHPPYRHSDRSPLVVRPAGSRAGGNRRTGDAVCRGAAADLLHPHGRGASMAMPRSRRRSARRSISRATCAEPAGRISSLGT